MNARARTISVFNDFLRDEPNQLDNHTPNRDWLAALVRHLAGARFRVRALGNDQPGPGHLDTAACMRALELPTGPAGWAAAWDREPSGRFVELLAAALERTDLVVGFGLPNVVVRALEALAIRFVDLEISPLRFASNLELDARTNISALTTCPAWQVPLAGFEAAAADFVGWAARFCPNSVPADAGAVGVIFGQIDLDAALLHDGRIVDVSGFIPEIRTWAEGLDHVLFRPHPYAAGSEVFEQLRDIVPRIRPTLMNSYQLLASQRLDRVLALSSGIIDEAAFFHTPATRLFVPKRRASGFPYSIAANLNLLGGDVLEAVLDGAAAPPVGIGAFDLRKQFRTAWGLTDTPVPSDFHEPPTLAPRSGAGARPQPPLPPPAPSPPRHHVEPQPTPRRPEPQPLGPAFPQPRAKLRHRLRKVARKVAGFMLPGGGRRDLSVPPAAADAPSPAGTPCAKDFRYGSGERQTAHEYRAIRRDHRARYELAHHLLPHGIAVLDLFCGNGYGSFLLAENRDVLGIDGSQPAIEVADRCFRRPGARFAARCYPFEDGRSYDAIVSYESIEHVSDGGAFFQFLVRHLRPGGWILYSTPNEDLLPFDRTVHIHHHRHYTHRETLQFARAGGLTIESWFGQDVYEPPAGGRPTLLAEDRMELQAGTPGQFTVVIARKPAARAA